MTSKPISPIAAQMGQRVAARAIDRCSCDLSRLGEPKLNPTCPVHGHGRPAGSGK